MCGASRVRRMSSPRHDHGVRRRRAAASAGLPSSCMVRTYADRARRRAFSDRGVRDPAPAPRRRPYAAGRGSAGRGAGAGRGEPGRRPVDLGHAQAAGPRRGARPLRRPSRRRGHASSTCCGVTPPPPRSRERCRPTSPCSARALEPDAREAHAGQRAGDGRTRATRCGCPTTRWTRQVLESAVSRRAPPADRSPARTEPARARTTSTRASRGSTTRSGLWRGPPVRRARGRPGRRGGARPPRGAAHGRARGPRGGPAGARRPCDHSGRARGAHRRRTRCASASGRCARSPWCGPGGRPRPSRCCAGSARCWPTSSASTPAPSCGTCRTGCSGRTPRSPGPPPAPDDRARGRTASARPTARRTGGRAVPAPAPAAAVGVTAGRCSAATTSCGRMRAALTAGPRRAARLRGAHRRARASGRAGWRPRSRTSPAPTDTWSPSDAAPRTTVRLRSGRGAPCSTRLGADLPRPAGEHGATEGADFRAVGAHRPPAAGRRGRSAR